MSRVRAVLALVVGLTFAVTACEGNASLGPDAESGTTPSGSQQGIDGSTATSINGGGHIQENDWDISFAGEVDKEEGLVGGWVVQFHSVSKTAVDGGKFEATGVADMNFFDGNSESCDAAMNMTLSGTFNGESGWKLIFRAGDAGQTKTNDLDDTARVQLSNPNGTEVYDTHDVDFTDESSCVGSARTGLDVGNLKIKK